MIEIGWGREAGAFREVFANLLIPEGGKEQLKWIGELQRRSASPETACRLWNAFHAFDIRAEAANVTVPTLVFHARGDAMVPFEAGRRLAAMIPNARFVPLESKNHILLPHENAWAMFRKELNDFLNSDEQMGTLPGGELSDLTAREKELLDCIARGLAMSKSRSGCRSRRKRCAITSPVFSQNSALRIAPRPLWPRAKRDLASTESKLLADWGRRPRNPPLPTKRNKVGGTLVP
jgi:hypothetical protein